MTPSNSPSRERKKPKIIGWIGLFMSSSASLLSSEFSTNSPAHLALTIYGLVGSLVSIYLIIIVAVLRHKASKEHELSLVRRKPLTTTHAEDTDKNLQP